MAEKPRMVQVEDYEQFVGAEVVERVKEKARPIQIIKKMHNAL